MSQARINALRLRLALAGFQGLLMILGSLIPAHATIIPAGKDAKEDSHLEALSHEAGKKHNHVVGIEIGTPGQCTYGFGTGIYIGLSADGKKGLILTAAHLVSNDPTQAASSRMPTVILSFLPELNLERGIDSAFGGIPVQRAVLHPRYGYFDDLSEKDGTGKAVAHRMAGHDLAILEFDAIKHKKYLTWIDVAAAELYDGSGYTRPLLEAEIVGFGRFGTSRGATLSAAGKLHAGKTRVTFDVWRGRTSFLHWSPLSEQGRQAAASSKPDANVYQFDRIDAEILAVSPLTKKTYPIVSHRQQALCASGDSGSPLFVNTSTGLKVAGIYSQVIIGESLFSLKDGKRSLYILQLFEPVKQSLSWIQAVREGGDDGGRVINLGPAQPSS